MEWVETTGKSLAEAKEEALERLGIGPDDAEFEILEEPRTGLFGRIRGEARVRARVKPAAVRPKQDRRQRRKGEGRDRGGKSASGDATTSAASGSHAVATAGPAAREDTADIERDETTDGGPEGGRTSGTARRRQRRRGSGGGRSAESSTTTDRGDDMTDDNTESAGADGPGAGVAEVRQAAEEFTNGLLSAFGIDGTASSTAEGNEIEVRVDGQGEGLGLLIGPGGRTLLAIQDLARVAAQRRLGDHETRLRIDVAGYREKRRAALEKFAHHVADLVKESGVARSLDPMPSADRKVVHDTLAGIEGVTTRSEGEDPYRRIIVTPA